MKIAAIIVGIGVRGVYASEPSPAKNRNQNSNKLASRRNLAFTLVELLAVIAIIAALSAVATAVFRGGSGSFGPSGAASIASGVFNAARTEAIIRRTRTRVVVDTFYNSARAEVYRRRLAVAYFIPTGGTLPNGSSATADTWQQVDKWTVLPNSVFYDDSMSAPHGKDMSITFGGPGASGAGSIYHYYEYLLNGQANIPASNKSQFIVAPGAQSGNTVQITQPNLRYGFVLKKMGRVTFFQAGATIPTP